MLPVVIIGGGPAGMSCALWLSNFGIPAIIIESAPMLGGLQCRSHVSNKWVLGAQAVTGAQLAQQFAKHIRYERIQHLLNSEIIEIMGSIGGFKVSFKTHDQVGMILCSNVVIAAGTEPCGHSWFKSVNGADLAKKFVRIGTAQYTDPEEWFGCSPVIIGGGDSAVECAIFLAARGMRAKLIARSSLHASKTMLTKILELTSTGVVQIFERTVVTAIKEGPRNARVILSNGEKLDASTIFIMFGYKPRSADISKYQALNNLSLGVDSIINIDDSCQSSIPGVYAIGDIANGKDRCVAMAIAMGSVAARRINYFHSK